MTLAITRQQFSGTHSRVAGKNLDPQSLRAATTGTSQPNVIVAAVAPGRSTGVVVAGSPLLAGGMGPRVRAFTAAPENFGGPQQLADTVNGMIQDGLFVRAAITGGRANDQASGDMNLALIDVLDRADADIEFDDSYARPGPYPLESAVVGVIRRNGDVVLGNHVDIQ